MLHFGNLLPPCRPPLLRILPLLPQSHQGIETLAKVENLGILILQSMLVSGTTVGDCIASPLLPLAMHSIIPYIPYGPTHPA